MPYLSTPLQRSGGSIPASSGSTRSRSSSSSSALLAAWVSVCTASSFRVGAAPSQLSVMHSPPLPTVPRKMANPQRECLARRRLNLLRGGRRRDRARTPRRRTDPRRIHRSPHLYAVPGWHPVRRHPALRLRPIRPYRDPRVHRWSLSVLLLQFGCPAEWVRGTR